MASVYSLWALMRIRDFKHWQEKWADTALRGCRPKRLAEDEWIDLALASTLVDGSELVGVSIDWSKCFARVSQGIAPKLLERQRHTPTRAPTTAWYVPRVAQAVRRGRPRGEGGPSPDCVIV